MLRDHLKKGSSGVLAAIGDVLGLVVDLENVQSATTVGYTVVFLLYLLSTALLLLGLVGLYTSQSEAAGILGLVGFLVAFLGTVLLAGALWFELFITPALAEQAPGLLEAELGLPGFILMLLLGPLGGRYSVWLRCVLASTQGGLPCF